MFFRESLLLVFVLSYTFSSQALGKVCFTIEILGSPNFLCAVLVHIASRK